MSLRGYVVVGAAVTMTVVTWAMSTPVRTTDWTYRTAELFGALALVGFAFGLAISTRWSVIDHLFEGQDKAYVAHKWLGITSILMALVHLAIFELGVPGLGHHGVSRLADVGIPSLVFFSALSLIALIARRLRYEVWRIIHRFIVLPYGIGLVHYYGSSSFDAFGPSWFSAWMDVVNLIGICAGVYTIVIYPLTAFRFKYKVSHLDRPAHSVVEITGVHTGKPMRFRPGQFAFVRFPGRRFGSHPFTMSNANPDEIQFTIKALGDHTTTLVDTITVGDSFSIAGPHGKFDYTRGGTDQLWIAGGIGITPFRSFLCAGVPSQFNVDFFYAYHGNDEAAYLNELMELTPTNLRVHLIDDTKDGFLTAEMIAERIAIRPVDVYFCGPGPMRTALTKGLTTSEIPIRRFHYERFGFGR